MDKKNCGDERWFGRVMKGFAFGLVLVRVVFFFFKQKTAYEIGTGDWSSDVCSSDLSETKKIF